jgi:hypothetical protein
MKFINREGLAEFIDDENRLVAWGGRDTWRYAWEPELKTPPTDGSGAVTLSTNIMDVVPNSMLAFSKNEEGDFGSQIEIKNVTSAPIVYKVGKIQHILEYKSPSKKNPPFCYHWNCLPPPSLTLLW